MASFVSRYQSMPGFSFVLFGQQKSLLILPRGYSPCNDA
jgi:hypothetical protein